MRVRAVFRWSVRRPARYQPASHAAPYLLSIGERTIAIALALPVSLGLMAFTGRVRRWWIRAILAHALVLGPRCNRAGW